MKKQDKTKIYDDQTYFGGYLEATDEKGVFITHFLEHIKGTSCSTLLDLGCFSGELTRRIAKSLQDQGVALKKVTAVEPASQPLEICKTELSKNAHSADWNFANSSMEDFLTQNTQTYDWTIVSHSLYWMKDANTLIGKIVNSCRHGVMVMRDQGMLYQIEKKFRPLMTAEKKTQFSSQDLERELKSLAISYNKSSFLAEMAVPSSDKSEFAQLVGFLLDLQDHELNPELFQELYQDMNVRDGFASYGIDMLWFQGQGK
jgi:2-polyprenyl-3-methyl-5-hydroxy-6-metoxy-1,4-benzoquinol methylase